MIIVSANLAAVIQDYQPPVVHKRPNKFQREKLGWGDDDHSEASTGSSKSCKLLSCGCLKLSYFIDGYMNRNIRVDFPNNKPDVFGSPSGKFISMNDDDITYEHSDDDKSFPLSRYFWQ